MLTGDEELTQYVGPDGSVQLRRVAGRLRYAVAPERGTVVGPREVTREFMVVLGQDGEATLLGYATPADLEAAASRMVVDGLAPRSLAEVATLREARRRGVVSR